MAVVSSGIVGDEAVRTVCPMPFARPSTVGRSTPRALKPSTLCPMLAHISVIISGDHYW